VSVHVCAVLCVCGYITSPRVSFWGWATAIKRRQPKKNETTTRKRERETMWNHGHFVYLHRLYF
jgi:hypothetical protein